MKIFSLVFTFLPLLALAIPAPEAEGEIANIEKRAITCALTGSDVRYRRSPNIDAPADGQFGAAGTKVSFSCRTTGSGVGNTNYWDKIASGKGAGDYVTEYYVNRACAAKLPKCP